MYSRAKISLLQRLKMFDVFQNVLFGKKKSNTDSEKEKTDADDFVVLGQTPSDQAVKEPDSSFTDFPFPVSVNLSFQFPITHLL